MGWVVHIDFNNWVIHSRKYLRFSETVYHKMCRQALHPTNHFIRSPSASYNPPSLFDLQSNTFPWYNDLRNLLFDFFMIVIVMIQRLKRMRCVINLNGFAFFHHFSMNEKSSFVCL